MLKERDIILVYKRVTLFMQIHYKAQVFPIKYDCVSYFPFNIVR